MTCIDQPARLQHDVRNVINVLVGQCRSLATNDQKYVLGINPARRVKLRIPGHIKQAVCARAFKFQPLINHSRYLHVADFIRCIIFQHCITPILRADQAAWRAKTEHAWMRVIDASMTRTDMGCRWAAEMLRTWKIAVGSFHLLERGMREQTTYQQFQHLGISWLCYLLYFFRKQKLFCTLKPNKDFNTKTSSFR